MEIRGEKDEILAREMLVGASDRAAAIVAVAYVEDKLTSAIRTCLKSDKDAFQRLFKPTGPLGPMGAKLQLGYLLSLYSKEFRDDLEILAKVRNDFAHWAEPATFDHKEIRIKAEALGFQTRLFGPGDYSTKPFKNGIARFVFISTADMMAGHLSAIAKYPDHPRVL